MNWWKVWDDRHYAMVYAKDPETAATDYLCMEPMNGVFVVHVRDAEVGREHVFSVAADFTPKISVLPVAAP